MSHYIKAHLPNGTIEELSAGINWRTVCALAEAGFDIYADYDAARFYEGPSGCGSQQVDEPLACRAFIRALATAAALLHTAGSMPTSDLTDADGKQLVARALETHRATPHANTWNGSLGPEILTEAGRLASELVRDLHEDPPDNDSRRRSLENIDMFLDFARRIYEASRMGRVEITYS